MICSVDDCGRTAEKRGWCGGHYYRWRMHGSPTGGRVRNGVQRKYLEDFIDPQTDACCLWPFPGNTNGYGRKFDGEGYAHQIICKKFKGSAPTSQHEVAHGCGNPLCINPRHIRWATPEENNADKIMHGTQFSKLNADAVRAIRASTEAGVILATRYGVTPSTISNVRLRKVWDRSGT